MLATDPSGNTRTNTYQANVSGNVGTLTYDPNGNMTGDGTKTYQWDAENRLVAVLQGSTTLASFAYGGTGKRKQKTVGGVTHTYVYDQKNVIEERIGSTQTLDYVQSPGIDRPLAQRDQAAVVSYYLADHLGSLAQMTNGSAAVTLTREYDPWGNLLQGGVSSGFAFTGREWDAETGLAYHRARFYRPASGTFISGDPLGTKADVNLYRYAANNPVRFGDPLGLCCQFYQLWYCVGCTCFTIDAPSVGCQGAWPMYIKYWPRGGNCGANNKPRPKNNKKVGEPYEPDPIAGASPDVNPKDPPDPSAKQEINIDDLEDYEQQVLNPFDTWQAQYKRQH